MRKTSRRSVYKISLFVSMVFLFIFTVQAQRLVHYDLVVKDTTVNYTGKTRRAIAVNGQIPMPTLEFTEGDTAEIVVHNYLREGTSLHWHGIFLENKEDGVPFLTQMPIQSGSSYTYRFPIVQSGTHWYHSHSGLQEQIGMYGSFIIHKRENDTTRRPEFDNLPAASIVLSEWTDMKPEHINRMLHRASDWFAIRKGATQSYAEAIRQRQLTTKLTNEWKRMSSMDVSDIHYDQVLINGKTVAQLKDLSGKPVKAGDRVRLRVVNGGASSYFWLNYSGGKMTVIASDGNDVEPVTVDRMLVAVSETYDVVVTVPSDDSIPVLTATTEDRTNWSSYFIGDTISNSVRPLPRLNYFAGMRMMNSMMKMNGNLDDMGMHMSWNQMDMNAVMYPEITDGQAEILTLNYAMLKSPRNTTLPEKAPVKELTFTLSGNMSRYVWSMDNRVLAESDKIPVKQGEVLRIVLHNNSMMRHPMHLHGFDFRLLNGKGDYAPLKNVIDIMPMETDTIEFLANREGDWFFHCHILYHMMAGMNKVLAVGQYQNPNLPHAQHAYHMLQHESNMVYWDIQNDFATNGNDGMLRMKNARWTWSTEWRLGYNAMDGYEAETHLGRYVDRMQWLMPFIGFDWRYRAIDNSSERNLFGQRNSKNHRGAFSLGIAYTLPFLINMQSEVYHDGHVRVSLLRDDIALSPRWRTGFMWNTDYEYRGDLSYIFSDWIRARLHYDSDMGVGLGVRLNY